MKKYLSIIISILILTLFVSMNTFAAEDNEYIKFHDHTFRVSELSKETLNWLKWYNLLSDDSKDMINYVPWELSAKSSTLSRDEIATQDAFSDLGILAPLKSAFFKTKIYEYIKNLSEDEFVKVLLYLPELRKNQQ